MVNGAKISNFCKTCLFLTKKIVGGDFKSPTK